MTHLLDTHAWIQSALGEPLADQLIVATALVHGLRLISDDSRIRQWGRVPLLWRTSRG